MIIFHQNNVGREVQIGGEVEKISYVAASGAWFRVESGEGWAVVPEYSLRDIEYARLLTISFDEQTWSDVSIKKQGVKLVDGVLRV